MDFALSETNRVDIFIYVRMLASHPNAKFRRSLPGGRKNFVALAQPPADSFSPPGIVRQTGLGEREKERGAFKVVLNFCISHRHVFGAISASTSLRISARGSVFHISLVLSFSVLFPCRRFPSSFLSFSRLRSRIDGERAYESLRIAKQFVRARPVFRSFVKTLYRYIVHYYLKVQ